MGGEEEGAGEGCMPTSCQLQLPVWVERGSKGDGSNQSPAERAPSLSSCPTGRLLELNPTLTSASVFPTTQTHSSQWGQTLQTPHFPSSRGALTQQQMIQDSLASFPYLLPSYSLKCKTRVNVMCCYECLKSGCSGENKSPRTWRGRIRLGISMRNCCSSMNKSCVNIYQ